jgi:eukaryotic-like serine/threonine-protein kinase
LQYSGRVTTEHTTLLLPDPGTPEAQRGVRSSLPPDLLEQVRGRLRLLAMFIMIGTAIDPFFYFISWVGGALSHIPPPPEFTGRLGFQWVSLGTIAVSAALRWAARSPRVSTSRLVSLGLAYEIVICFSIALTSYWEEYVTSGGLPGLTWVAGVVILFPLILPGPPRRMAAGAIAAAAMSPLALLLLDLLGKVKTQPNNYLQAIVSPGIAVVCAYFGARVIYGLGRQLAAARELGSYRLEEKLGQGGMGEVWRARHRMLARPAAIKLIRNPVDGDIRAGVSEDRVRRFKREAQATASLRSPHTVNLFDFGVAEDGAFYYVMELLDGLDASTMVTRFGPLPAERAVYLLRQVCHSLSEAESRHLVHRDIKPANIFICRYGEDHDFVKVLDFGLVKALSDADGDTGLTRGNVIQGTPAFIAPEQALGRVDVDGRVDIYATGCVAYWLLTGHLVFDAPSPMALLVHHAHTPPSPPSSRTEMPIPEALDKLVLSCLEKDPDLRPQSARELSNRLAAVVDPDSWTEERARSWWSLHGPAQIDGA